MTTQFDCALDGVTLSSLDEHIVVLDIIQDAPRMEIASLPLPSGGRRILASRRESICVQIRFAIHEEDPLRRQEILQDIHAWAMRDGMLTITPRPGQRLKAACTLLPALSLQDWPEEMTLAFTSAGIPWWEADAQIILSGSDAKNLQVPGTADQTCMDVIIINNTETVISDLTIHCGSSYMAFRGLSMASGSQLILRRMHDCLTATLGERSVLHCRTIDSCDEFDLPCGQIISLSVEAEQPLYTIFQVRGRYA